MSAVITIAGVIGVLLAAALILFSVFTAKKVPLYFTAVMAAVGGLSILSSVLIFVGTVLRFEEW